MLAGVLKLLSSNRKLQVLAALLVVAVVADASYYAAVCRPAAVERDTLAARLERLGSDSNRVGKELGRFDRFMELQGQLGDFKSLLATRTEYVDVLVEVYDLAKRDGMSFSSIGAQTSALPHTGGLEQISFSLPVSGQYRNVRKFIYDIENSELFLNINNLGLTRAEAGEISLTIGLSTYVRS